MFTFIVLLMFYQPFHGDTTPITCYNDQGEAVDWFYLYKLPHEHGKPQLDGERYLLMEKGSDGWTDGKVSVNDSTGALGRTVGQLYGQGKNSEIAYILYNDQRPPILRGHHQWLEDIGSQGGHTKGVVILDKQQGFWLVHSTPHFPPVLKEEHFSYPSSGVNNGQNFVCVTYSLEQFDTIGEQLQINQPSVYDCAVPASLASLVPSLDALCKNSRLDNGILAETKPESNRSVTLTSLGGTNFLNFAKGRTFDNDLYHSWVAPTLQSDLLVQFWVRSTGILPSDCSLGWKVLDIKLISPGQSFTFKATQDHSKWAVSVKAGGGGWVCVGDINRNKAEEKRGGGTVCLQDPVVWKAYRTAALECEMCGGEENKCGAGLEDVGYHHRGTWVSEGGKPHSRP